MFIAIKIITQELDTNSNEVKNLFNNLKITFPNKEYRKMQKLFITLNELKLKENRKKVKILTENNDIQSKVKKLHMYDKYCKSIKERSENMQNNLNKFDR